MRKLLAAAARRTARCIRTVLSGEAGAHHRAVRARRRLGSRRAPGRGEAERAHGRAVHRREPARRRQQPRRRARGQVAAGWIHAAPHFGELHGQSERVQAELRSDQRHHADHPDLRRALRRRGASVGAGEYARRVRGAGEEAAGEVCVRLVRKRQHHARGERVLPRRCQDQGAAHPVQRDRAGGGRTRSAARCSSCSAPCRSPCRT